MKLSETIKILDEVIPPPHNKMVDSERLKIAIAWQEIRTILCAHENILAVIADMFDSPCKHNNIDEYMSIHAGAWCEENCGREDAMLCWAKYLVLKTAEGDDPCVELSEN